MNQLLLAFKKPHYRFQVKSIENRTSERFAMPYDSSNFIKTPLVLHMNGLDVVAYEPYYNRLEAQTTGFLYFPSMKKKMPQLVINGAITQFDKGVYSKGYDFDVDAEFGRGHGDTDFRYNRDRSDDLSQIALDLTIFKYLNRTYLPGVATQNKIEISRRRKKDRFGLFLNGSGIGYSKYATMQQSKDEALRILTEYSLIQLLGRLYELPYWRCVSPNMEPDHEIINKKVEKFVKAETSMKKKMIEQLIRFYALPSKIDGKLSKEEQQTLLKIVKTYKIQSNKVLSAQFYQELYTKAPIFESNIPKETQISLKKKSLSTKEKKEPNAS